MKFSDFGDAFRKQLAQVKEFRTGEWFPALINRILTEHAKTVNAETFLKKYPALDRQRIAQRLVKVAEHHAGLSGAAAASAISAAELSTSVTAGASIAVAALSFAGEISATTYIQLAMVFDIFLIMGAPFDLNDPEDIMTMFWYAFGVNKYESIANLGLKSGPRTAEYLGRKALRNGIREAMQKVAARLGGQELAKTITEKALLKLIVPGINLPIAYTVNKYFTRHLGKIAIRQSKKRAAALTPLRQLERESRIHQLLTLPVIYHVGIKQESEDQAADVIEMQDIVTRHLRVTTEEEEYLDDAINLNCEAFLESIQEHKSPSTDAPLYEIAAVTHLLTGCSDSSMVRFRAVADCLSVSVNEAGLTELREHLEIRPVKKKPKK